MPASKILNSQKNRSWSGFAISGDIRKLCDDFHLRAECPSGKLTRAHLRDLVRKLYPQGFSCFCCYNVIQVMLKIL